MEIGDVLGIAIVGAILSVVVQIIKDNFGSSGNTTRLLTIFLALFVGGGYVWLRSTPFFETTLLVLGTASAVYALLIRQLE